MYSFMYSSAVLQSDVSRAENPVINVENPPVQPSAIMEIQDQFLEEQRGTIEIQDQFLEELSGLGDIQYETHVDTCLFKVHGTKSTNDIPKITRKSGSVWKNKTLEHQVLPNTYNIHGITRGNIIPGHQDFRVTKLISPKNSRRFIKNYSNGITILLHLKYLKKTLIFSNCFIIKFNH